LMIRASVIALVAWPLIFQAGILTPYMQFRMECSCKIHQLLHRVQAANRTRYFH
jgi:hypothetical protein